MRSLLRKDLLILGRSRLLVALLVLYPVVIALLIGLAISRAPSRPRVAIVDETPPGEIDPGRRPDASTCPATPTNCSARRTPSSASSRADAVAKVQSGEVLAAVVIPPNLAARVASGTERAHLEVIYNGNALEQSLVRSEIESALAEGEPRLLRTDPARGLERDRRRSCAVATFGSSARPRCRSASKRFPPRSIGSSPASRRGRPARSCVRSTKWPASRPQNLDSSKQVLATIGQPIEINSTLLNGRRTPLNSFAVVVAVAISLMFVGVLLAAGSVALEREEGVLARLLRGLVSRERC